MKFAVTVTLKKDVLDPQGKVVGQTLKNMGIKNLNQVRQGKFFEIDMNDSMLFAFKNLKLFLEPACVAGFAALKKMNSSKLKNKNTLIILCGSNIDFKSWNQIIKNSQ